MNVTRQEIELLEAGNELDCLVAEHVMGVKLYDADHLSLGASGYLSRGQVPSYSNSIEHAMRVLTQCEMKHNLEVGLEFGTRRPTVVWVGSCTATHRREPLAICQAALRAVVAMKATRPSLPALPLLRSKHRRRLFLLLPMDYTRQQVNQMPAGLTLDKLIATHVFCYEYLEIGTWQMQGPPYGTSTPDRQIELEQWLDKPTIVEQYDNSVGEYWIKEKEDFILPIKYFAPSTDLTAAWGVFEWLKKQRVGIGGHMEIGTNADGFWIGPRSFCTELISETLPLALCRAALSVKLDIKEGLEDEY